MTPAIRSASASQERTFSSSRRAVGTTFDNRHTFDTDKAQAIADMQVAVQYCRCGWFVRGGWQAQYWDTVAHTDNDDFDAARASLGLSGFFVTLGGQR